MLLRPCLALQNMVRWMRQVPALIITLVSKDSRNRFLKKVLLSLWLQGTTRTFKINVDPRFGWRSGLAINADYWFSISQWKTLDFSEISYTSKQCSQMTTIDLKVKLLEQNRAFSLCLTGNYFIAGASSRCSDSQKNVMFNEPNTEIIMPLIFGTHTK